MTDFNTNLILELIRQNKIDPDFSKDDYDILINLFSNKELNQFYMFIVRKVLTKKQFEVASEDVLLQVTATLADKVDLNKIPTNTNNDIKALANTSYSILMILDIKEFINERF